MTISLDFIWQVAQTFGVPTATVVMLLVAWYQRIFISRGEHEEALKAKDAIIARADLDKSEEARRAQFWQDACLKSLEVAEQEQDINRQTIPIRRRASGR